MTNNDQLTMAGIPVKHAKKLGNKNALKHGLNTQDAKKRLKETEIAIKEVRQTMRKIAEVYPNLGLTFEKIEEEYYV